MLRISIRPRPVFMGLAFTIAFLAVAHVLAHAVRVYATSGGEFYRFFSMEREANLPTYFSTILLLATGILLVFIALDSYRQQSKHWWEWALLAVGFCMMSVDEAAQIHERIIARLIISVIGRGEGIWYYIWYAAYIPLLIILLIVFMPFLRSLSRRYFMLFAGAGLLFVAGAIGVEMGESYLISIEEDGMILGISTLIEEVCEMAGVALFIYALLRYMGEKQLVVGLSVQSEEPTYQEEVHHAET